MRNAHNPPFFLPTPLYYFRILPTFSQKIITKHIRVWLIFLRKWWDSVTFAKYFVRSRSRGNSKILSDATPPARSACFADGLRARLSSNPAHLLPKNNHQTHSCLAHFFAEVVGFEPTVPVKVRRFSRPLPSTTQPHFRK